MRITYNNSFPTEKGRINTALSTLRKKGTYQEKISNLYYIDVHYYIYVYIYVLVCSSEHLKYQCVSPSAKLVSQSVSPHNLLS